MAKNAKPASAGKNDKGKTNADDNKTKRQPPPRGPEPEFGIQYLAEATGREPHLVRVSLRAMSIPKNGGRYAWETKAEADKVVKQLTERSSSSPAKGGRRDDDDDDDDNGKSAKGKGKAAAPAKGKGKGK